MIGIRIGDKPLAGFGEPIEMLKDCHRRIEHFLDVLGRVAAQSGAGELTQEARPALQAALSYFADFAPRHTADEEDSLFPRLRQSSSVDVRAAMADLDRLEEDHRRCENCHARVDELGRQWLAAGRLDERQQQHLREAVDELQEIYAAHIALEEQVIFALAAQILEPEQVRRIGEEMRERRQMSRPRRSDSLGVANHRL